MADKLLQNSCDAQHHSLEPDATRQCHLPHSVSVAWAQCHQPAQQARKGALSSVPSSSAALLKGRLPEFPGVPPAQDHSIVPRP